MIINKHYVYKGFCINCGYDIIKTIGDFLPVGKYPTQLNQTEWNKAREELNTYVKLNGKIVYNFNDEYGTDFCIDCLKQIINIMENYDNDKP